MEHVDLSWQKVNSWAFLGESQTISKWWDVGESWKGQKCHGSSIHLV